MRSPVDVGLLKDAFHGWNDDKAPRLAAAISFSTVFAIAPLFIVVIAIAGAVLGFTNGGHGHHLVENRLVDAVRTHVGTGAATMIREVVDSTYAGKAKQGVIAQLVGYVTFILGAMGLFAALQDALNTIWHVEPPKNKPGWLVMVRDRLASFGLVVGIGFLLLVTFAANAAIAFIATHVQALLPFPGAGAVFGLINALVSLAIVSGLFAAMYKVLPDVRIGWSDVWHGAIVTAVLFVIGQAAIGWYLGRAGVSSAYGAAGSLLVLLLWVYYSAMIMLFGAEFTRAYAATHGSHAEAAAAATVPTVAAATPEPPAPAARPLPRVGRPLT